MIDCKPCRSKTGAEFDGLFGMVARGAGEIVIRNKDMEMGASAPCLCLHSTLKKELEGRQIALSGEGEPHYESGPLSLSFVTSMMSVSCNDTIQLSLPGPEPPSQRYCQLLEVRRNEPFEVIHNDLAAFFPCYVCGGSPFSDDLLCRQPFRKTCRGAFRLVNIRL